MCGIVGALAFENSSFRVTEGYIDAMRDTMPHRGPDGAGTWIDPGQRVGLGHRRLSIIDLSTSASQPMSNEDETLWVVFNGEIYNHAEVRAELNRVGKHIWKTDHSDTEVLLHAFEQWGIECLHKFRGMFALAFWDRRSRQLWLVRDRIGVKPLYYSIHHGRITFASEIKALLKDPDQARAVNEEALFHYLSFLTAPAPQTLFEGIRKLPSGTWLRVDDAGQVQERRYWDVWDHVAPLRNVREEEITARILDELRTAVKLRKVSDVPVGVFLSGGIDSSTNAALFSEGESRPVKTFTIGYRGEYSSYQNELQYARRMAKQVGAEHHECLLDLDDLLRFLPEMVYLQDEPIADPVCVPLYYVSKLARDNQVIVCQVGEGADELFCGYPGWKRALEIQRYDDWPVPSAFKRLGLQGLRWLGKDETTPYEWLRRGAAQLPIFWGGAEAFTDTAKRRLLASSLRQRFSHFSSWEALKSIRERFEESAWDKSHLHWMTYVDLNLRLPELLLMRVDKMSMGASLEGRVPFLDHKFVELVLGISANRKIPNGNLKYLLKRTVRGVIPDELIDRPKQGFGVPVHEWFLERLGLEARKVISSFCDQTGFLDRTAVSNLLAGRHGAQSWYLLNLALWWRRFFA
ncbi:MAG: asparagine synthase (glutamine-hydrolyzing) [Acidobacteriota bacterium]